MNYVIICSQYYVIVSIFSDFSKKLGYILVRTCKNIIIYSLELYEKQKRSRYI